MIDPLIDTNPSHVLAKIEGAEIAGWSDARRNEFCEVFGNRVKVARYLLVKTAHIIMESAKRRRFISDKHDRDIFKGFKVDRFYGSDPFRSFYVYDTLMGLNQSTINSDTVGGRSIDTLGPIADQRAKEILKSLPPLARAVEIIDVETARKIDRRDKLLKDGEKVKEGLDEVCGTIVMEDLDQGMTLGAFRKMVKDRDDKRRAIITKLNEISKEGRELEESIARKLYAGLPGLSEAVVDVIRTHLEQSLALDATSRRVEEQVKFGDSEAAVEMLRHFEKDEVQVSEKVKHQFTAALEALKLSVKKPKKSKELRT
jgi:hypothetical protein